MSKYRYTGVTEVLVPDLNLVVKPGDCIESAEPISHGDFVLIAPALAGSATKVPERPAKE